MDWIGFLVAILPWAMGLCGYTEACGAGDIAFVADRNMLAACWASLALHQVLSKVWGALCLKASPALALSKEIMLWDTC